MSNVLVGIMGVILFVGLAMAGALYIAPSAMNAKSNTKAAEIVQTATQVAAAINQGNSQNVSDFDVTTGTTALMSTGAAGLLKLNPKNPMTNRAYLPVSKSNMLNGTPNAAGMIVDMIMTDIGVNPAVCLAIEKLSGGTSVTTYNSWAALKTASPAAFPRQSGCIKFNQANTSKGGLTNLAGSNVVYVKV